MVEEITLVWLSGPMNAFWLLFAGAADAMPPPASRPAPAVTIAAMAATDRLVRLIACHSLRLVFSVASTGLRPDWIVPGLRLFEQMPPVRGRWRHVSVYERP